MAEKPTPAKQFVFTITTGRSGTAYLSDLLRLNLRDAEVHHERTGFQSFGVDTPDASHFTLFNSVGNVAKVRQFWTQKTARMASGPRRWYVETSHFLAKAGLIENIGLLADMGRSHIVVLRRDTAKTVWSLVNHHDFANLGFTWLFALDPRYPNRIVDSAMLGRQGMVGCALWYVLEMQARGSYYKRLLAGDRRVNVVDAALEEIATAEGARKLLAKLGAVRRPDQVHVPPPRNETKRWPYGDDEHERLIALIARNRVDPDAAAAAFIASGHRLADGRPGKATSRVRVQAVDNLPRSESTPSSVDDMPFAVPPLASAAPDGPPDNKIDDGARSDAQARISEAPRDGRASFRLGNILFRQGRTDEAVTVLERAAALLPDDFIVRNLLTMALYKAGRRDDAIRVGLAAMRIKDKAACDFFARPDFKDLHLRRAARPFSEDKRRNIICFSLWGDKPIYTDGAVANARMARHLYPCWTCRFYVDDSVPEAVLDRLRGEKAQVVPVPPEERGPHGGPWRFFVADDPAVDRFICRDCDSRLNTQERAAVDEWIASGKAVHIMRDHAYHNELILAGLWGAVGGALPPLKALIASGRWFTRNRWFDQYFLWGIVWPLARDDHLAHDTFYRYGNAVPFPEVGRLPSHLHVGGSVSAV